MLMNQEPPTLVMAAVPFSNRVRLSVEAVGPRAASLILYLCTRSPHIPRALIAAGLVRYALFPSGLKSSPPACRVRASRTSVSRRALYRGKEIPSWLVFPFLRIVSFWPILATWSHVRGKSFAGFSPAARHFAAL